MSSTNINLDEINLNDINQITLDLSADRIINVICKQDDLNTRKILITLTNDGEKFIIDETIDVRYKICKPDNTFIYNDIDGITDDEDGNRIYINLTDQCTSCPGISRLELQLAKKGLNSEEGQVISTMSFNIIVKKSVVSNTAIESTDEFGALNNLLINGSTGGNQNAFSHVMDTDNDMVSARNKSDTLHLIGNNIEVTTELDDNYPAIKFDITKDNVVSALGYTPSDDNHNHTEYAPINSPMFSGDVKSKDTEGNIVSLYDMNETIKTLENSTNAVSEHNVNTESHNDLRLQLMLLETRIETVANSDDVDLDQLKEIVDYIKANRSLIESITTSKVSVTDIIDNLTTNVTNKPLSAAQGVAIKSLIDNLNTAISRLSGAEPNQNAFSYVMDGDGTIVPATSESSTLQLLGKNININETSGESYPAITFEVTKENIESALGYSLTDESFTNVSTGERITVTNSADAPVRSLKIDGKTEQEEEPTTDNPNPKEIICVGGSGNVEVTFTGKNLFGGLNFARALSNISLDSTIDEGNRTVTFRYSDKLKEIYSDFKEGVQYTFILYGSVLESAGKNNSIIISYNDGTLEGINIPANNDYVVTTTAKGKTVSSLGLYWMNASQAKLYYDKCGIFEGVVSSEDFEEYKSQTINIPLTSPLYEGDYIHLKNGKLEIYREFKMVDFPNITSFGTYGDGRKYSIFSQTDMSDYGTSKCTHMKEIQPSDNVTYGFMVNQYNSVFMFSADDTIETANTKMSGAKVLYRLAEPTTEIIETDIDLSTYCNVTHISNADNGNMEVEYFVNSVNGKTVGDLQNQINELENGFSNVENKSSATIRSELTKQNVVDALGYTPGTATSEPITYELSKSGSTITLTSSSGTTSSVTDSDTTYKVATSSTLGLVKSGTDITVDSSGNVSVNDDSHNHVISNVDGLQSILDGKVNKKENIYSYNHLASYYSPSVSVAYYRIKLPDSSASYWTMMTMEITLRQNFANENGGKIIINAHHSDNSTEWTINASTFGTLSGIKVYASDGKYFYITGGIVEYSTITIDKVLVGDSITNLDLSNITIDTVSSLPTIYQTATMSYGLTSTNYSDILPTSTTSANGLMSSTDKSKLDGIASGANAYVHPTTAGNKHIPSGGSSGQYLKWSSSGTATWASVTHPTISTNTDSTSTASPSHGGTFTAIDSVTRDSNGHVTKVNTKTVTLPSDTSVTNTLNTTTKAYLTGTTSSSTNTGTQVFDTGVYLGTTAGELNVGFLKSNGDVVAKDLNGNTISIASNYLTQTKTVYVSTSGNDSTGDGTSSKPWRTIQHAVDMCPIHGVSGEVAWNIYLSSGTYSENVTIINKNVYITITGGSSVSASSNYKVNSIVVQFSKMVYIKGVYFSGRSTDTTAKLGAHASYNTDMLIEYCKFNNCRCVASFGGRIALQTTELSNYQYDTYGAVHAHGGVIRCYNISGSSNTVGYCSDSTSGGDIYINSTCTLTGTTMISEVYGGKVHYGESDWILIGSVTGNNTVNIYTDIYTDIEILFSNSNINTTMYLNKKELSLTSKSYITGYYTNSTYNASFMINASLTQITLQSVYLNGSSVLDNTSMIVYGKRG